MSEVARRFLGDIIFLRHGQTKYADVFPDLTPQGKKTIHQSAHKIWCISDKHRAVIIKSSPLARAQGSASIIASVIGFKDKIIIEDELKAIVIKDIAKGKEIFDQHITAGGLRQLAVAYGIDARYENPEIFDKTNF